MSTARKTSDEVGADDALEQLTEAEREAVRRWRQGGMKDAPDVAALRKKIRGEPLTDEETALLADRERAAREWLRSAGPRTTVPHDEVMRLLEERRRRGG